MQATSNDDWIKVKSNKKTKKIIVIGDNSENDSDDASDDASDASGKTEVKPQRASLSVQNQFNVFNEENDDGDEMEHFETEEVDAESIDKAKFVSFWKGSKNPISYYRMDDLLKVHTHKKIRNQIRKLTKIQNRS